MNNDNARWGNSTFTYTLYHSFCYYYFANFFAIEKMHILIKVVFVSCSGFIIFTTSQLLLSLFGLFEFCKLYGLFPHESGKLVLVTATTSDRHCSQGFILFMPNSRYSRNQSSQSSFKLYNSI